jgi:phosphatidate cytidylyltransferase
MTGARIATAALLIPAVVAAVWWGPTGLVAVLAAAIACLALFEFFLLAGRIGLHGYLWWTLVCALAVFFAQWAAGEEHSWGLRGDLRLTRGASVPALPLELVLFVFVLGAAVTALGSRRPLASALGDFGVSAAALVFVALPLSTVVRLDGIAAIGPRLLLFVLVLVWVGDTVAYFVGRWFGRLPLAPQVSPAKTWEGAVANLVGSLAVGAAFAPWLRLDPWHILAVAGLASIAGQVGDLLESAYKRSAGVKDSGTLLPGHGGVLDRIDALILAAPVVWYYFDLVVVPRR